MAAITYIAKRELVNDDAGFVALLNDLGGGQCDITLHRGLGVATFTRATAAACRLASGLWKLDVASGVPRSHYLPDLSAKGYLYELGATQLITPSAAVRDMTNAAWVKSASMTAAKTSTGIDGVANSCTRLTAGAANQTALFTLTAAASQRVYSFFVRRITGSGAIQITQDNGGTWTTVSVGTSFGDPVQLSASILNAVIGIRIVTSGDAIDVDCNQFEADSNLLGATTPIPAAGTRNSDLLRFPMVGNFVEGKGTIYAEYAPSSNFVIVAALDDGAENQTEHIVLFADNTGGGPGGHRTVSQVFDGGVAQTGQVRNGSGFNALTKAALSYELNAVNFASNGTLDTPDTSATMPTFGAGAKLYVGQHGAYSQGRGIVRNLRVYGAAQATLLVQQTTLGTDYAHLPGSSYNLEFKAEQIDPDDSFKRNSHQPIGGGGPETLFHRHEEYMDVLTEILTAAQLLQWREFLASVAAGETFTFDPYGTIAVPDDPRPAVLASEGYKPQRVGMTMQYRVPFRARLL